MIKREFVFGIVFCFLFLSVAAEQMDMKATPVDGTAPLVVSFEVSPAEDITSYQWDFNGDGTEDSTTATSSYTYSTAGTYTATCTVTDSASATDTASVGISVNSADADGDGIDDISDLCTGTCGSNDPCNGVNICDVSVWGLTCDSSNHCAYCGNNIAEGAEACDGSDFKGDSCSARGWTGGTLSCTGCTTITEGGCW